MQYGRMLFQSCDHALNSLPRGQIGNHNNKHMYKENDEGMYVERLFCLYTQRGFYQI